MSSYEKDRYWKVYESFIKADFRPSQKGSQSKAAKHFKDVALVIIRRANYTTKKCWPSLRSIQLETSLSECTVRRNIVLLETEGMISKRTGGGSRSNNYVVNFDHKAWCGDQMAVAKLMDKLQKCTSRLDVIGPDRIVACPSCGGRMDKRSRQCIQCTRRPDLVHDAVTVSCTTGNTSVHDGIPPACTMEERLGMSITPGERPAPPASVTRTKPADSSPIDPLDSLLNELNVHEAEDSLMRGVSAEDSRPPSPDLTVSNGRMTPPKNLGAQRKEFLTTTDRELTAEFDRIRSELLSKASALSTPELGREIAHPADRDEWESRPANVPDGLRRQRNSPPSPWQSPTRAVISPTPSTPSRNNTGSRDKDKEIDDLEQWLISQGLTA
jgi:hypothetical protein